jgi:hypothetical protein
LAGDYLEIAIHVGRAWHDLRSLFESDDGDALAVEYRGGAIARAIVDANAEAAA